MDFLSRILSLFGIQRNGGVEEFCYDESITEDDTRIILQSEINEALGVEPHAAPSEEPPTKHIVRQKMREQRASLDETLTNLSKADVHLDKYLRKKNGGEVIS